MMRKALRGRLWENRSPHTAGKANLAGAIRVKEPK